MNETPETVTATTYDVDDLYYLLEQTNGQLEMQHQTIVAMADYNGTMLGLLGLIAAFVACLLGFKIARGR